MFSILEFADDADGLAKLFHPRGIIAHPTGPGNIPELITHFSLCVSKQLSLFSKFSLCKFNFNCHDNIIFAMMPFLKVFHWNPSKWKIIDDRVDEAAK